MVYGFEILEGATEALSSEINIEAFPALNMKAEPKSVNPEPQATAESQYVPKMYGPESGNGLPEPIVLCTYVYIYVSCFIYMYTGYEY